MKERISPYVRKLIKNGNNKEIALQFRKPRRAQKTFRFKSDALEEEKYSPVKGLVHKFKNRALIKLTLDCAGHCQHCTRSWQIGDKDGDLSEEEIVKCSEYIQNHPEIDDVILSGGDPMFTVLRLIFALNELLKIESVKVIRIGTRMPFFAPDSFKTKHFKELLKKMRFVAKKKHLVVLFHVNHPKELTKKVLGVLQLIKRTGAEMLTQTVFLKGVNDNVDTLEKMCSVLYYENGIRPYYIYRCDYVEGKEHFVVSLRKEEKIMTELRKRLSGPAYPTHVVDLPGGRGKIPVPLDFWIGARICLDFDGKKIKI